MPLILQPLGSFGTRRPNLVAARNFGIIASSLLVLLVAGCLWCFFFRLPCCTVLLFTSNCVSSFIFLVSLVTFFFSLSAAWALPFYLYRSSCGILGAAVLLLYYANDAETLLFSIILYPGTTPPLPGFSDISFPFRQTPDCSDILTFFFFFLVFLYL